MIESGVPQVAESLQGPPPRPTTAVVIPARLASTRLAEKPLADIAGRPMIVRVYERASAAAVDTVIVATDDRRIVDAVVAHGGRAQLTAAAEARS